MRTRFWRKRNAKLDKRLNTVIETTERARKSIKRPPSRVTIDTSYLDVAGDGHAAELAEQFTDELSYGADTDGLADVSAADTSSQGEHGEFGPSDDVIAGRAAGHPEGHRPNSAAIAEDREPVAGQDAEEAYADLIQRLDNTERELQAVYEAAEQQEQAARETHEALQREIEARKTAEEARDALEQSVEKGEVTLAALRSQVAAFEAGEQSRNKTLEKELANRRTVEVERQELAQRLEATEAKLASAHSVHSDGADRLAAAERARDEAETARDAAVASRDNLAKKLLHLEEELQHARAVGAEHEAKYVELQESVSREAASRSDAEAAHADLSAQLNTAVTELETLRASIAAHEAKAGELTDALAKEAQTRQAAEARAQEAESRLAATASMEAELLELRTALQQRDGSLKEAEQAVQRELSARYSLEADLNIANDRLEVARHEIEALRKSVETNEAVVLEAVEKERDELLRRVEEAERRISEASASAEGSHARLFDAEGAVAREMDARRSAEVERDEWARRAAEAEAEVLALKTASAAEPPTLAAAPVSEPLPQLPSDPEMPARLVTKDEQPVRDTRKDAARATEAIRSRLARKAPAAKEEVAAPTELEAAEREPARKSLAKVPEMEVPAADANVRPRTRRVESQMPAMLWREGMGQPLSCTLRDRSPSGAKVEFRHASMIEGFAAFNVGDHATLTLNSAHEKTWVNCEVVWVDGNSCGLRFAGQFHSESPAPRKATRHAAAEKTQRAKSGSRLSSVFSLRGS